MKMLSKQTVFILIAIFFVFSYPWPVAFNLNTTIGWHTTIGRPWFTYLIPAWFLLISLIYQTLKKRGKIISNYFFWTHALLSIVPPCIFNYPFVLFFLHAAKSDTVDILTKYNIVIWTTDLYVISQIIFMLIILFKLFRNSPVNVQANLSQQTGC